jgi:hypothetical protein
MPFYETRKSFDLLRFLWHNDFAMRNLVSSSVASPKNFRIRIVWRNYA